MLTRRRRLVLLGFLALLVWARSGLAQALAIRITADLTDAPRKLFRADLDLPVKPGPLTLTSPQWIPGTHRPLGAVSEITGVVFSANGATIPWRRDDVDLYEFHLTIPDGVSTLHAHLDCIATSRVSQKMAVLEWEKLLLYPAHRPVRDIAIQPSLKVPPGWGIGTALSPTSPDALPVPAAGSATDFAPTDVEQLEDTPVLTGEYFHEYALAPTISPKHYLDVAADYPEDANLRAATLAAASNLIREADALYASHHYHAYHFLLTMSDVAGDEGLEHGESSDNGVGEKGFADDAHALDNYDLLSHEFTHSWNGKYRRPAGLYQPDFATPQQGALLWVYEGMTQYLGDVLAARSGFETPGQFRDLLAMTAANLDSTPGRSWRSTTDTAVAASILRGGDRAWFNWRRGQDYYFEGLMLWLDADTLIRKLTNDKKSLDDFQKIFLAKGGNTGPLIVTYTLDELVTDLHQIAPYDWAKFLHDRVNDVHPHVDLAGIEQGGYKLVYRDKPSASEQTLANADMSRRGNLNCWYSIGIRVGNDGRISDVLWNGPADKARIAPGDKIIAVNNVIYSNDVLGKAIRDAKGSTGPIRLILQADNYVRFAEIEYHDGERYPALERIDGTTDYLDEILKPLTEPEKVRETSTQNE